MSLNLTSAWEFPLIQGLPIPLGAAWAANTINTVAFRQAGLVSACGFQFTAFFVSNDVLRIVKREIGNNDLQSFDLKDDFGVTDAHKSISLGIDGAGCLHLAYSHHASKLRYRKSLEPLSIVAWSDELGMTGRHEDQVTYPAFVSVPAQGGFLFLFRDGTHSSADVRLKRYSVESGDWIDAPAVLLSGSGHAPWKSCPYLNTPVVDRAGRLHLGFVWRTRPTEPNVRITNVNVGYACSPDLGSSWLSSLGRPLELPMTQVNAETVWPISPGSNLINQSGMSVDSLGRPHIVFYSDDHDRIPQYQHLWFDGRSWRHAFISSRTEPFLLSGRGTLPVPISRPVAIMDDDDRLYVLSRSDMSAQKLAIQRLSPPDYEPRSTDMRILWDEPLGFSEVVLDLSRWSRERVLSAFIQRNLQEPDEKVAEEWREPALIVDWNIVESWL